MLSAAQTFSCIITTGVQPSWLQILTKQPLVPPPLVPPAGARYAEKAGFIDADSQTIQTCKSPNSRAEQVDEWCAVLILQRFYAS